MQPLTPKQRQYLKGLAHSLSPLVQIGQSGRTPAIEAALEQALLDHELVKVKFGKKFEGEAADETPLLAKATNSAVCQVIGGVAVLYRPRAEPEKRKINLPRG